MRAIVIYASCEGQTQRIARCIARTMNVRGIPTDTFNVTERDVTGLAVESYEAVVLGAPLHYGEHESRIASCISQHHALFAQIPTAFFSVSLGVVSKHEQDREHARKLADDFLRERRLDPSRRACFAGALRYSKYGWLKKQLMHWIAAKSGAPTQTDRDYEYTDWDAVESFAGDFAEFVHGCRQPKPKRPRFAPQVNRIREYLVPDASSSSP